MAHEEEKWAADMDSAESHKKLLEKKVMAGHEEAEEQLKAAQQQWANMHNLVPSPNYFCLFFLLTGIKHDWCYMLSFFRYHLVLQETKEESRMVANNLAHVFSAAVNHLDIIEVRKNNIITSQLCYPSFRCHDPIETIHTNVYMKISQLDGHVLVNVYNYILLCIVWVVFHVLCTKFSETL